MNKVLTIIHSVMNKSIKGSKIIRDRNCKETEQEKVEKRRTQ